METVVYTEGQKDKYTGEVYTQEQTTVTYKNGVKHSYNDTPAVNGKSLGGKDKIGYKMWFNEGKQVRLSGLPTYVFMFNDSRQFENPQYGETTLNLTDQLQGFIPIKFEKGTPNTYKTLPIHPDLIF